MPRPVATHVDMVLPEWLSGRNPDSLLKDAGVRHRYDKAKRAYVVQTEENYHRRPAELINVRHIAGPATIRNQFEYLATRTEHADHSLSETALNEIRRRENTRQDLTLLQAVELHRLRLVAASIRDLPGVADIGLQELRAWPMGGEPPTFPLADAGLHLIDRSKALNLRLKIPRLLTQLNQDERASTGDVRHFEDDLNKGRMIFQASEGLADGVYLLDPYLGPLMGSLTPYVWGFTVPRTFGTILCSFGESLGGVHREAAEFLQLVPTGESARAVPKPHIEAFAWSRAIDWWSSKLNYLFAVLSDFAVFASDGQYRPNRHLHAALTTEQLFRRVTSLLVAHRDLNARLVLLFSVLDTLERLTNITLETRGTLAHATKVLSQLEADMPPSAASVLLPAARRGVAALGHLQDGFFFAESRGARDVGLRIGNDARTLSKEKAAALYLKALRDATHGHGSDRPSVALQTDALLAQHDGHLSADLGMLGYLYLLEVMANPERLRSILRRWSLRP